VRGDGAGDCGSDGVVEDAAVDPLQHVVGSDGV